MTFQIHILLSVVLFPGECETGEKMMRGFLSKAVIFGSISPSWNYRQMQIRQNPFLFLNIFINNYL